MVLLICKQIYISTKTYTSYTAYLILRTYSARYLLQMPIIVGFDVKGTNSKVVALGAKKGKCAIGKFGDVARGSKYLSTGRLYKCPAVPAQTGGALGKGPLYCNTQVR